MATPLWLKLVAAAAVFALTACSAMAQGAVVDNGSDPSSQLNMREQPSRDAQSLGKFYSGTRVEIVRDAGGGWSQVTIGGEQNSVSGYMMSSYLSEDGVGVVDGTLEKDVVSPYGTQSVVLRSRPSDSYDAVTMLAVGESVTVIGVSGDYYYVQLEDSSVGCLSSDELK